MQVICLQDVAFYALIEEVVDRIKDKYSVEQTKWIKEEQAMDLLNVKAKSTMQQLRDNGKIRFSQPQKKIIVYDRDSIAEYLEKHAKDTF
jgi:hypothetical protein